MLGEVDSSRAANPRHRRARALVAVNDELPLSDFNVEDLDAKSRPSSHRHPLRQKNTPLSQKVVDLLPALSSLKDLKLQVCSGISHTYRIEAAVVLHVIVLARQTLISNVTTQTRQRSYTTYWEAARIARGTA